MTLGIARLRMLLVGAMGAVVALAIGDVFDERHGEILVVPGAITAVALAFASSDRILRLVGALVAVVGSVVAVAFLAGGALDDAVEAFTSGPQRLLTTDWPSPSRPDLIATTALVLAMLVALSAGLARRSRLHLLPLLPIVAAHALVIALSAPRGPDLTWVLALGVLGVLFALFRPGVSLAERWTLLIGERQAAAMSLLALALAALVAIPLQLDDRADPRRNDDPDRTARLIDPIEATIALQAIDPPAALHTVVVEPADPDGAGAGGFAAPLLWRTAALSEYDGRRWEPSLELRPIGRRLAADGDDDLVGSISFEDDDLQLVPFPGDPVLVDADIDTDPARTIVRLADRPVVGEQVDFRSRPPTSTADVIDGTAGTVVQRQPDETASALTDLAETLVADAAGNTAPPPDLLGRLRLLESALRDGGDFLLDPGAAGGGLQRGLIVNFLQDSRRGNAEQFVTSFVLLARSLSVDARVATGYRIPAESFASAGSGSESVGTGAALIAAITSADAAVWPEVNVGGTWLAFDPVPAEEVADEQPEPDQGQQQSPAAPQPPLPPPRESDEEPEVSEVDDDAGDDDAIPAVVVVGLGTVAVIGALMVPVLVLVGIILGLKRWRRRRRLSGPPRDRIRGTWAIATDRLIDAGMAIGPASTNDEIADVGVEFAPTADREIHRLASLANAATFGEPARTDLLVDDAASCLGQVETSLVASRTRWQRLRWRLSLRSLRRGTRSPV